MWNDEAGCLYPRQKFGKLCCQLARADSVAMARFIRPVAFPDLVHVQREHELSLMQLSPWMCWGDVSSRSMDGIFYLGCKTPFGRLFPRLVTRQFVCVQAISSQYPCTWVDLFRPCWLDPRHAKEMLMFKHLKVKVSRGISYAFVSPRNFSKGRLTGERCTSFIGVVH